MIPEVRCMSESGFLSSLLPRPQFLCRRHCLRAIGGRLAARCCARLRSSGILTASFTHPAPQSIANLKSMMASSRNPTPEEITALSRPGQEIVSYTASPFRNEELQCETNW